MTSKRRISKVVKIWLWIGFIMILFQILIGGVTRLTGSGLSITRWDIVTGTLPPFNMEQWMSEFDKYRATPQYEKINQGMSLKEFKFIYFWEYFHRLWARLMGFVFLIPAIYFWTKGMFPKWMKSRVVVIFLIAAMEGAMGWIMVASGLIERPWVSAYNLSMHLSLAVILLGYILWTLLKANDFQKLGVRRWHGLAVFLNFLLFIQIFVGGMVSGMHAALLYPTFPKMKGEWIPSILTNPKLWHVDNFIHYDKNPFFPALMHTIHRLWAYLIILVIIYFLYHLRKIKLTNFLRYSQILLIILLFTQITLGILTVINSIGNIPVFYGVSHQMIGILLFNASLLLTYGLTKE